MCKLVLVTNTPCLLASCFTQSENNYLFPDNDEQNSSHVQTRTYEETNLIADSDNVIEIQGNCCDSL